MFWLELASVTLMLLLVWLWKSAQRPKNFPPGPRGLPLFGYAFFLGKYGHLTLRDLGNKYGNVYSLTLGSRHTVVLNDWKAIKAALVHQSDNFSGRPYTYIFDQIRERNDIVSADGPLWKENRQFTNKALGIFGFGKSTMEVVVMEEVHRLMDSLNAKSGNRLDIKYMFFVPLFNIIWSLVGGKRVELDDPKIRYELTTLVNGVLREGSHVNVIHFLPFLKRYHPGIRRKFLNYVKTHYKLHDFLNEMIDGHMATYREGSQRDVIDVFLAEMYKRQKENADTRNFHREKLQGVLYNLNNGGIDTGNSTLEWGLMYMSEHPEIQAKVQRELDSVIGRERLPALTDRPMLPYTQAVLLEIQRIASVLPLSFPHCPMHTTKVLGYTIPKGTFVFENLWAVHHDPNYWGDPDVFRPERFITPEGAVKQPEYLIPFSTGKRICMGESLAKLELFLFFAAIMHQYRFSRVPGQKLNFEPINGLTLRPPQTTLLFEKR